LTVTTMQPRTQPRAAARSAPIAVVDIGSNSVRLVIAEGARRAAPILHNEKAICGIGRNMVSTGRLDEDGVELAIEVLARFRQILAGHNVAECEAVATAAARDAENGRQFVTRAEKALGQAVRVLSGEDEARIAAEGVLAGIPGAQGVAADLGGGSLDMVSIKDGRTGMAASLPIGPLRLMDMCGGNLNRARDVVNKKLDEHSFGEGKNRALYAVGGVWRTLARVDMEQQHYPVHVLHHYEIPANRALKLCRLISGQSRKSLEKMRAVSRRRAEALPFGALVLERMIETYDLDSIVVSAFGLREGLLQRKLPQAEARKDPLIEYAEEVNARESRNTDFAAEMFRWMTPLFGKESAGDRRVRLAACLMSDIGWRRHPDDRAMGAFDEVLNLPYGGADHRERATMASAVYHRYAGDSDFPEDRSVIAGLLGEERTARALHIGLAARLAYALTAAVGGELSAMPLKATDRSIAIEVPNRRRALASEGVHKRLDALADAMEKKGDIALL
jgi:exopolyphosphatase/guanosine-5'-triphosphate,3'-diphosphate pyrophosphatase